MTRGLTVFVAALAVFAGAIGGAAAQPAGTNTTGADTAAADTAAADTIYVGGRIWTGNNAAPEAEAMAVRDGRIVAIGGRDAVMARVGETTMTIDLGGKRVVPGLIDSHVHFLVGGKGLASVKLRDAATPAEFARRIGAHAAAVPKGQWIRFGDWDHELWGGELPHHDWIDALTPDHPVFVTRLDGHMGLANARAMELAGITPETQSPAGGEIVRDADGRPTGVFKDRAQSLIMSAIPAPGEEELDRVLDAAIAHALSKGVTQIHDMADFSDLETFRRARAAGRLHIRAYSLVPLEKWRDLRDYVAREGRGDDLHHWGGLKGYVDGSLGSTTAWFYEPYSDAPGTAGFPVNDLSELGAWIRDADAAGLQVVVHAIGDRANNWLLDSFAEAVAANGPRDRRFRIEHAQHFAPADIPRLAELGVIASMQPYHAIDDGRWAEKRIGPERIKTTYAFRALLDAGARLAFGSDWFVAPLDPVAGLYAAATRRTFDGANPDGWVPEQIITVEQALKAYTAGAAHAEYREDVLGSLEVGKYADFVVLSDDILAMPPAGIENVRVLRTVVGGIERYRAE